MTSRYSVAWPHNRLSSPNLEKQNPQGIAIATRGGSREGAIFPPKTYERNFIHHDLVQFRKQHSRLKAILSSIVLLQQCREVYFISLTVAKP